MGCLFVCSELGWSSRFRCQTTAAHVSLLWKGNVAWTLKKLENMKRWEPELPWWPQSSSSAGPFGRKGLDRLEDIAHWGEPRQSEVDVEADEVKEEALVQGGVAIQPNRWVSCVWNCMRRPAGGDVYGSSMYLFVRCCRSDPKGTQIYLQESWLMGFDIQNSTS